MEEKFRIKNKAAYTALRLISIRTAVTTATRARNKNRIKFKFIAGLPNPPGLSFQGLNGYKYPLQPSAGWAFHHQGPGLTTYLWCKWLWPARQRKARSYLRG